MDLNDPLGMRPRSRRPDRRLLTKVALGAGAVLAASALAFAATMVDPRAGEPMAVAAIPADMVAPRPVPVHAQVDANAALDPASTASLPRRLEGLGRQVVSTVTPGASAQVGSTGQYGSGSTIEGGVRVFRGQVPGAGSMVEPSAASRAAPAFTTGETSAEPASPKVEPLVIDVSKVLDDPLNRRVKAGAEAPAKAPTPFETAFAAAKPAVAPSPRVAIFVGGMGLNASATKAAIEMPAAVTLAFVPAASATASLAGVAKAKGHEILVQLPMANGWGASVEPHALKPGADPSTTRADLAWLMKRVAGYDGVVNLLGAPVMADAGTMTAVLEATRSRGLFFLDDGTSRRSRALILAGDLHVPAGRADVVLDATADPAVVRANLDRLVALAKRNGSAIGMASGLPEHLGTIARFAAELGAKGVTLVPVGDLLRSGSEVASVR